MKFQSSNNVPGSRITTSAAANAIPCGSCSSNCRKRARARYKSLNRSTHINPQRGIIQLIEMLLSNTSFGNLHTAV